MPPPSPLAIATSSVTRLLKEEQTYRQELETQQHRVEQLQSPPGGVGEVEDVGNSAFTLRQEQRAYEETKAVFGPLRERIDEAMRNLERLLLESGEAAEGPDVDAAKDALARAKGTA